MKSVLAFSLLILFSVQSAFAWQGTSVGTSFSGTFYAPTLVPDQIEDVKFDAYNYAKTRGPNEPDCGDPECYRIDVYLNDIHVATFATSPGKPHPGTQHVGGFTPNYDGVPIHSRGITHREYVSFTRRYYMPYAMFFERLSDPSRLSNVAIHSGHPVTGWRLSRGCLRTYMQDAEMMFNWVRAARRNGGNGYFWSRHMRD